MASALRHRSKKVFFDGVGLTTLLDTLAMALLISTEAMATKILVLRSPVAAADDVIAGFNDETDGEFELQTHTLNPESSSADEIGKLLSEAQPQALLLIDNISLRLYKEYQSSQPEGTAFPPAIALMAAFAQQSAEGLVNTTGIAYEVPAVTSMVNLRSILGKPIKKVIVLYRKGFGDLIAKQRELAKRANIELVGIRVKTKRVHKRIRKALRRGMSAADARWVLNDSKLLSKKAIVKGWLPALAGNTKPVVVGVPSILKPELSFGSFGVLPDHFSLGTQAASMIFELADNDWKIDGASFGSPVSVEKVLNMRFAKKHWEVTESGLAKVDRVVE